MAKFIYRMQNILNIKYKLEESAKQEYAEARQALVAEEQKLDALKKRQKFLGKDEVTSSNLVSSSKKHLKSSDFGCFSLQKCTFRCGSKCGSTA
mgnify:CR=1 FL=1